MAKAASGVRIEPAPPARVVTLLASATEIVCALGCRERLVGRSHECDFPPGVEALPVCTAPKFEIEGLSYEIDQRIRAIVEEALSVYRVDAGLLRELRPDLVITQSQCEVCAVSERDLEAALRDWVGASPATLSLEPHDLGDVWTDIRRVGVALGVGDRAERLLSGYRARIDAIAASAAQAEAAPRVACIEWIEPLMSTGNWMPELIALAGGANLFGEAGRHSPWMRFEELAAADPDVILVMPCGFDIARTRAELPALSQRPAWGRLRAVRAGRTYLADGNQYFNRSGPRLVESLEILAEVLHPGRFDFGHRGGGWAPA